MFSVTYPEYKLKNRRFMSGARACDTHIYNYGTYPFDLIGPATIIWRPSSVPPQVNQQDKGRGKATKEQTTEPHHLVWIRAHPSIYSEVHLALRTSASFALDRVKVSCDTPHKELCEVEIVDLRDHFNIFEIMGPKSSQVIKGALKPVPEGKRKEFKEVGTVITFLWNRTSIWRSFGTPWVNFRQLRPFQEI